MPDYSFSFDPAASGLPYTIKNRAGETVGSGTLDESDDVAKVVVTLPWGTYDGVASAASAPYTSSPAYFAKGELLSDAPGATETAYFVATGSGVTDEDNDAAAVIADPAHGALPSWISVAGNVITVNRFVQLLGGAAGAFTANFPTTLPGGGDGFVALFCDAQITVPDGSPVTWFGTDYYSTDEATEDLEVETNPNLGDASNCPPGTTITFFTQGGAYESDGTTPVTDGTYEGTAYFAFQAQMFAPVLPA